MHSLAALLGPAALATKEFTVDKTGESGRYVKIVGRKSGLVDWILSLLKIDTTTTFEVYEDHIKFAQGNFSGNTTNVIPLTAVSTVSSGYFKPIIYLLIGIPLLPCMGLGVIPIIYYFLHKTLVITTDTHSGFTAGLAFKSSVIEGIKIDQERGFEVIEIINHLVAKNKS